LLEDAHVQQARDLDRYAQGVGSVPPGTRGLRLRGVGAACGEQGGCESEDAGADFHRGS
jgi:hypothetical protein